MTPRLRLPRAARIRDERSFLALRRAGRVRGRWFVVAAAANGLGYPRVAVRVAKKVMKSAVARNRIRRCVREVFRQRRPDLAPADYLITLMRPYCETALDDARAELGRLLSQAAK